MGRYRVLVVEDNATNVKLLRDVLEATGYYVLLSETAEQGIELARSEHPDVILMDVQLPGMDGVTALRALKQDPLTKHIPVVAVTASAMPQEREQIISAGFDGYQSKPLAVKELLAEVAMLAAREVGPGGG